MFKSVGTTAWAVNGQNNEYTNSFRPSDLEFKYIYVLSSPIALHLIYSQNCFKCLEDNITVQKATLLFDDIQNQQHTQNNMWSKWFLDAIFSTLVIYLFKREIEW